MKKLLIIDDEQEMLNSLEKILSQRPGFKITLINDSTAALKRVAKEKFDIIITDLKMKEASGLDILRMALKNFPDSVVIVISGYGTIETSVEAMQLGAFDFIEKPFTSKKLFNCIERALNQTIQQDEFNNQLDDENGIFSGLIYKSQNMQNVLDLVKKVAQGNMNVLITGESGTGKELIARAIHRLSNRKLNPFVPVNCGALPEHLFESELFGHEKGAFTGAINTKPGLIEFADQGSFFFDEIGDLSLALQVKLLRMLEERHIRRVGGKQEISIDVRIIAATNKNITNAVQEGKFREDLYYRLNTIPIEIPALRERREDIIPLANHFLRELCTKNNKIRQTFSHEAVDALKEYSWPGNARELQNIISRAHFLCSSKVIQKSELPLPVSEHQLTFDPNLFNLSYKQAKEQTLEKFEIEYLSHHLRHFQGNISKTAFACGIDRRSIHRLIKKYNIVYKK